MAPTKAARAAHDESKAETPNHKEKNGHGAIHHSNGKMRRVASSAGSNLREVMSASAGPAHTTGLNGLSHPETTPGLQWPAFEREVLHAYRRVYHLNTPTSFTKEYHNWVLTQAGSVGQYSPTIARKTELRRQTPDQLATTVRKHFNGLGVQENDVIVDFLHKIRTQGVTKKVKTKRPEYQPGETEK